MLVRQCKVPSRSHHTHMATSSSLVYGPRWRAAGELVAPGQVSEEIATPWGRGKPSRRAQTCRRRAVRPSAEPQLICLHLVPAVSFVVLFGEFGLFRGYCLASGSAELADGSGLTSMAKLERSRKLAPEIVFASRRSLSLRPFTKLFLS